MAVKIPGMRLYLVTRLHDWDQETGYTQVHDMSSETERRESDTMGGQSESGDKERTCRSTLDTLGR
jgi:hypothetical protein